MKYLVSILAICIFATSAFAQKKNKDLSKYSKAVFAAGCFWHEEALFESIKGVEEAVSGYSGGNTPNPTYESIETGNTGHAESVMVYYDPSVISYSTLLKIYFAGQDPTQVNGQGNDIGTQYRSIVFYNSPEEKKQVADYVAMLKASGKYKAPIAVQPTPLKKFWIAEDYHQDFILHNPNQGYVRNVSIPEIKHFQKEYPELIKEGHKF